MDDERITSDGAAEHFNKDVLCGKLSGYSLCYSISSKDGGRADIREGEGSVEGILYTVRKAAVEYLFRREGVRAGRYRPAFVNVEADGRTIKNVLTFSVIEKKMIGGRLIIMHSKYYGERKGEFHMGIMPI